ncbi:MAG TPA: hypothetical protein VD948_05785, partial [Rhodothermales bacterium]|nr:hypothetical protein [Rhodothermales bacterium]
EGVTLCAGYVTVWDAEKGAYRRVNTGTLTRLITLAAKPHETPKPRPDAATVAAWAADFEASTFGGRRAVA